MGRIVEPQKGALRVSPASNEICGGGDYRRRKPRKEGRGIGLSCYEKALETNRKSPHRKKTSLSRLFIKRKDANRVVGGSVLERTSLKDRSCEREGGLNDREKGGLGGNSFTRGNCTR